MENISPSLHPVDATESGSMACCNSPSSSFGLTPLLKHPSQSDCSVPPNSIGSSSGFSVRPLNLTTKQMSTVSRVTESGSSATAVDSGVLIHPDPPASLPPFDEWVPASGLLEAARSPLIKNEHPVSKTINSDPNDHRASSSHLLEAENAGSAHVECGVLKPAVSNESSSEQPAAAITSNLPNDTVPLNTNGIAVEPSDEEVYRLLHTKNPQGGEKEVFDFPKTSRAQLYNYYIGRVQELRVLCDQGTDMNDLPVHSEEDYALLKTLTRTHGDVRWWVIMVEDLQCPECVLLLKSKRRDKKSRLERVWLKMKGKCKNICLCGDNSHDSVCHHTRKDMNKVTRFFHALGERNASRMVNISFETDPYFHVDIDVLASAVYNAAKYFRYVKQLAIKFHFHTSEPIERDRVKSIVCSMVRLEAMLPKGGRLHVCGLAGHDELKKNWCKRSRAEKWWL